MKHYLIGACMIAGLVAAAPVGAVTIVYPDATVVRVGSPQFTSVAGVSGTFTGSFSENGVTGADGTTVAGAGNKGLATKGAFAYDFRFQLPADGFGSGAVTTIFTNSIKSMTYLDLTSVTFNGMTLPINGTNPQFAMLDNVDITKLAFNDIVIKGVSNGNGSFAGNLSFVPRVSAAPEPATWAMMMLGFGIAGTGLRNRRNKPAILFA